MTLHFLTGNPGKLKEAKAILGDVDNVDLDLPEVQELDPKIVIEEKLKEAIDSLPLLYKASFTLVVFQEMTHKQAAQVLGCSENTVSWRLHKARKMLQAKLKPYLEGG